MTNIWFLSDLHLGHKNIINFSRQQFSTIEEHDEYICHQYHTVVKPNDKIYFLGDVAFGQEPLKQLNLNRNFIGFELDEKYFNIAKERIEKCQQHLI